MHACARNEQNNRKRSPSAPKHFLTILPPCISPNTSSSYYFPILPTYYLPCFALPPLAEQSLEFLSIRVICHRQQPLEIPLSGPRIASHRIPPPYNQKPPNLLPDGNFNLIHHPQSQRSLPQDKLHFSSFGPDSLLTSQIPNPFSLSPHLAKPSRCVNNNNHRRRTTHLAVVPKKRVCNRHNVAAMGGQHSARASGQQSSEEGRSRKGVSSLPYCLRSMSFSN